MMWCVWILLVLVSVHDSMQASVKPREMVLMYSDVLRFQKLDLKDTLEFSPLNKSETNIIFSPGSKPRKGYVETSGRYRNFIINSVTFEDEGTYRVRNVKGNVTAVYSVKVIVKRTSVKLTSGNVLRIPLDGFKEKQFSLVFSRRNNKFTLVKWGVVVSNKHFEYGRIQVATFEITVHDLSVLDGGDYTLRDGQELTACIISLSVTGSSTTKKGSTYSELVLTHGSTFKVPRLGLADQLEYTPPDESWTINLYSTRSSPTRGHVEKSGNYKDFIINAVTFDDQGTYKVRNLKTNVTSIYVVQVVAKHQNLWYMVGETLKIPLDGVKKENASLSFISDNNRVTLVRGGLDTSNKQYFERIQVTNSNIQLLVFNVSDVGVYTLSDHLNRTVSINTVKLTDSLKAGEAVIIVVVLLLIGAVAGICYCRRRSIKNIIQAKSTNYVPIENISSSCVDLQTQSSPAFPVQMYPTGYPVMGETTVHPPPNPMCPPQHLYMGPPGMTPTMTPTTYPTMNYTMHQC